MARPNFFADNENRAYPLIPDPAALMSVDGGAEHALPTSAIVDFHCVLGLDTGWLEGVDSVYLHAVKRRDDGTFAFEFRATAGGLAGYSVTFLRDASDPEFTTSVADAVVEAGGSLAGDSYDGPCGDDFLWEADLTTGRMDDLAAILAPGEGLYAGDGDFPVEAALVQDLARTYVRAVNLANVNRTHATPPGGCDGGEPASPDTAVLVNHACIRGRVVLRQGFNCAMRQNDVANSLTIAAAVGAGAGVPCEEVPLNGDDVPPEGSTLLSGGPSCDEVVSSLNGLSASVVRLVPGTGVDIDKDPTRSSTLVVAFSLRDLVTCSDFVDSSH